MVLTDGNGTPQVALRQLPEPVLMISTGSLFQQRRVLLKVSFHLLMASRVRVIS